MTAMRGSRLRRRSDRGSGRDRRRGRLLDAGEKEYRQARQHGEPATSPNALAPVGHGFHLIATDPIWQAEWLIGR
jgi:hypothetical protein